MIDQSIQEFLLEGIDSAYAGSWKTLSPGATAIETDGTGILVIHDREQELLAFAGGVLSGVTLSPDLVRELGKLNNGVVLGAYVLSEGQPGYWSITYAIKLLYNWVEESKASARMIVRSLAAVPVFVDHGIKELSPKFGGEPCGIPGGWWMTLMDRF